jgi:hypothetical protein
VGAIGTRGAFKGKKEEAAGVGRRSSVVFCPFLLLVLEARGPFFYQNQNRIMASDQNPTHNTQDNTAPRKPGFVVHVHVWFVWCL